MSQEPPLPAALFISCRLLMAKRLIIPDLCRNSSLLMVFLVTQILVIVAWLFLDTGLTLYSLGIWSLYAQWSAIIACFVLCASRGFISRQSYLLANVLATLAICASVITLELGIYFLINMDLGLRFDWQRFAQVLLATILLAALVLRFFALLDVLNKRSQAEAESRILALQSRIQPHFLFNSLNTISELTMIEPAQAEKAIGSLSMLFRAGLENQRKRHSLEREITLTRRYIELERWRLQKRLKIEWHINIEDAAQWEVPKLIIQPLVENAIVHGVQEDGRVEISIDIRETRNHLSFKIENKKGAGDQTGKGHGIAHENIRERLMVLYDDQQTFRVKEDRQSYSVIMRFPKQVHTGNSLQ